MLAQITFSQLTTETVRDGRRKELDRDTLRINGRHQPPRYTPGFSKGAYRLRAETSPAIRFYCRECHIGAQLRTARANRQVRA